MVRFTLVFLLWLLPTLPLAAQTTWYVDDDNCPGGSGSQSDPFCSIQDAIDAAANGDTVLVSPGTYRENLDFRGKAILVDGESGGLPAVIDAGALGPAVLFVSGEGPGTVLSGFVLTNGTGMAVGPYTGGGAVVCLASSSPTIRRSTITGNTADIGGAMICDQLSSPVLENCVFSFNTSTYGPGGVLCNDGASPAFVDCLFTDNTALGGGAGAVHSEHGYPTLIRCVLRDNFAATDGGAISCDGEVLILEDCEITDNTAMFGGGLYFDDTVAFIERCTITRNTASFGGAIYGYLWPSISAESSIFWANAPDEFDSDGTALFTVTYSDIQGGWPGSGNIALDPLFRDPANGDFRLASGSPCIDAGSPSAVMTCDRDLGGNPRFLDGLLDGTMRLDMGAHEFDNVHLEVTGNATPGGILTVEISGTAGLDARLYVAGSAGTPTMHPPYGCAYFSLAGRWRMFPLGTIPGSTPFTIPPGIPTPITVHFQGLALQPGPSPAGNTSNPVTLTIQ